MPQTPRSPRSPRSARAHNHIPTYRLHRGSGNAIVTLRGRDVYLGPFGSPESKAEYRRLIAEYFAAGCEDPQPSPDADLTWCELAARYLRYAEDYYRTPDGSTSTSVMTIKCALSCLLPLYGEQPVVAFGPIALKAVRTSIIKTGKSRKTVNDYVAVVKRIVKWGVGEELVPARIMEALRAVDGLKRGRSSAKETAPVRAVPDAIVNQTLKHCSPVLAAMIKLQRLTGMRPAEVCGITAAQIDMTGELWHYEPTHHKLAHLGPNHSRVVSLGPRAQEIVREFLRPGDVHRPLFSPAESEAWRRAQLRDERTTKVTASQARRDARRRVMVEKSLRRPSDRFDTQSYGRAIDNACRRAFPHPELAGVPRASLNAAQLKELDQWEREHRWSPNQLRHAAATQIRRAFGLDHAAAVLGHSELTTTQIYAERSRHTAEAVALALG
ncbi:MAG: site-specific integrase [Phycisphaerales bacterium]